MADYLFLSVNVARSFPSLIESLLVLHFSAHLPGRIALKWNPHWRDFDSYKTPTTPTSAKKPEKKPETKLEKVARWNSFRQVALRFSTLPVFLQVISLRVVLLVPALALAFSPQSLLACLGLFVSIASLSLLLFYSFHHQHRAHRHHLSVIKVPTSINSMQSSQSMFSRNSNKDNGAPMTISSSGDGGAHSGRQLHPDFFPNPHSTESSGSVTVSAPQSALSLPMTLSISQALAQSSEWAGSEGFQRDLPLPKQLSHVERVRTLRRDYVLLRTAFDEDCELNEEEDEKGGGGGMGRRSRVQSDFSLTSDNSMHVVTPATATTVGTPTNAMASCRTSTSSSIELVDTQVPVGHEGDLESNPPNHRDRIVVIPVNRVA
jgi:hypothetical protein